MLSYLRLYIDVGELEGVSQDWGRPEVRLIS